MIKCSLCQVRTSTIEDLLTHISEAHVSKKTCDLCTFESTTQESIETHKNEYHVIVQCTLCDKFVDSRSLLKKHMEEEHDRNITSGESLETVTENVKLKEELRAIKDDFERLSVIYNKKNLMNRNLL